MLAYGIVAELGGPEIALHVIGPIVLAQRLDIR